ncbi:MAG: hypothetical protein WA139_04075 [Candidatus Aenigmatarchaeota archaeon]
MGRRILFYSIIILAGIFFLVQTALAAESGNICNEGCALDSGCSGSTPYLCKKSWALDTCVAKGYDSGYCGGKTDKNGYCFECSGGCVLQSELGGQCGLFTTCNADEYCCRRAEWFSSNVCKPKYADMGCCGGPPSGGDKTTFLKASIINNKADTCTSRIKWEVRAKGSTSFTDYSADCVQDNPEITIGSGKSMEASCTSQKLPAAASGPHKERITWCGESAELDYGDSTPPAVSIKLCGKEFVWEGSDKKCAVTDGTANDNGNVWASVTGKEDYYSEIISCETDWDDGAGWETSSASFSNTITHIYRSTGAYGVKYRCTNNYGLVSDIASDTITVTKIDTTPPVVSIEVGDSIKAGYKIADRNKDDDGTVYAALSASDPESDIASCEISWDGGNVWWKPMNSNMDIWYYPDGSYVVKYRCANKAGLNAEASDSVTVSIPDSEIGFSFYLGDEKGKDAETDGDGYVWANIYQLTAARLSSCEISWDGGTTWDYANPKISDAPHAYKTTGLKTAKYRCADINGKKSEEVSDTITVSSISSTEPRLKILFVPMKWSGTNEEFADFVDKSINKFTEDLDLKKCPEKIKAVKMNTETESFNEYFSCSLNDFWNLRKFAEKNGYKTEDYDAIVGLIKDEDNLCRLFGIAGQASSNMIWFTTKYENSFAHEMGHIFGLEEQYCSNPAGSTDGNCNDGGVPKYFYRGVPDTNPLSSAMGCDPSGEPCCNTPVKCSSKPMGVCCEGNKNLLGGRSIMSYADAEGPRRFDNNEIAHLSKIPQLQC